MHRQAPVTVIIPSYNEEANIIFALESARGWADQTIVVDSFSADRTVEIAKAYGAEVYSHAYENMASQRQWSMQAPLIRNEWVFNLDADEYLTEEIKGEISEAVKNAPADVAGFLMRRRHIFMGRFMRYGGDYIWLLRLVRHQRCRVIKTAIANEHTIVNGSIRKLKNDFVHEPRKSFAEWMRRVNSGAQKFALGLYNIRNGQTHPRLSGGEAIEGGIRTLLNYYLYANCPLFLRPFVRFFVFYVLRGGFLDGREGFIYHMVNDFLYPFLVWTNFREYSKNQAALQGAETAKWRQ